MLRVEIKRKIIQYIVNKLTIKGFSVGCYCVDDCINMYVQKEKHYVTSVMSLTTLNEVEDKQCYIDYCISGIIEQFNAAESNIIVNKDLDKFVGFTSESVLKNWGKLVTDDIKNGLKGKKSSEEILMIDVLKNLGIELTPEEQDYFKDKVLTYVDIPGNYFTGIPDHKITITFNYGNNTSESDE